MPLSLASLKVDSKASSKLEGLRPTNSQMGKSPPPLENVPPPKKEVEK